MNGLASLKLEDPNVMNVAGVMSADGTSILPVTTMDDLDPSLLGGYRVIYDRETPLELRVQDADNTPQQVGILEAIRVKILILGDGSEIHQVRVELSTESDLFFLYAHTCDIENFQRMQHHQKLMIEFSDYANVLIRMLNSCIKEPQNHLAVYLMQADGRARLDFIQNMEYKFVELLSVDFMRSNEDLVRQHITFRYNSMKARLQILQTRLYEVNNIIKVKNPSLLLQLQKASASPQNSKARFPMQ